MGDKKQVPAIEGWFTTSAEPHLLGSQCTSCKSFFFPKESLYCRNPACAGTEFADVPLSRTGKIWSFTNAGYQPPPPYIPADPFVPFAIVGNITALVALDFLGFGLPAPTSSWGELLHQGQEHIFEWHLVVFPLLALFFTLQLTVFIGEAVRDAVGIDSPGDRILTPTPRRIPGSPQRLPARPAAAGIPPPRRQRGVSRR